VRPECLLGERQTCPIYLGQTGPIQAGTSCPVVYDGSSAATLTLPPVAWKGTVVDQGPGVVTLVGPNGSPVNGAAAGVTMLVGAGGAVTGDPASGWTYSGSTYGASYYVPIRVVTVAGAVTVSSATDYVIIINKNSAAATTVNYTCVPGFTFVVKDGAGNDAVDNITLTPSAGNIDGASTFIMNASISGTPPYEARAVTCDSAGNSWLN
jgi:hypothetical protein